MQLDKNGAPKISRCWVHVHKIPSQYIGYYFLRRNENPNVVKVLHPYGVIVQNIFNLFTEVCDYHKGQEI